MTDKTPEGDEVIKMLQGVIQFVAVTDAGINALETENDRLRAKASWQPIDTAPKDGNLILLCVNQDQADYTVISGFWDMVKSDDGGVEGWSPMESNCIMSPNAFSHWMPLPSPPTK